MNRLNAWVPMLTFLMARSRPGQDRSAKGRSTNPVGGICLNLCVLAVALTAATSLPTHAQSQDSLPEDSPVASPEDPIPTTVAEKPLPLSPLKVPLDIKLLKYAEEASLTPGICPEADAIIYEQTICQKALTIPSLWWQRDQERQLFGGRLFENWFAYPGHDARAARVDLVVNLQLWSLLNYLERYEIVNGFGIVAKQYGYNTRVFSPRGNFLAAYTCQLDPAANPATSLPPEATEATKATDRLAAEIPPPTPSSSTLKPAICSVYLDSGGKGSVRGRGSSLF